MENDLMRQQQQAARRVEQMQRYARRVFEEREGRPAAVPPPPSAPRDLPTPRLYNRPPHPPAPPPAPPPSPEPPHETPKEGLLSLFAGGDTEQWMLLGLALLLFRSGCKAELLLAVLYLAL